MDHSLRGYLERRSTEELDAILDYAVNHYVHRPEDAVRVILSILEEREKNKKQEITPELRALRERYLEKAKQQQKQQDI